MPTPAYTALADGEALKYKVVSVSAPTGYGKTVLLSRLFHLCQSRQLTCLWIGLQEQDTTLTRVLRALELAVDASHWEPSDIPAVMHQGGALLTQRIERFLAVVARLPQPVLLCIDNLSYCHDEQLELLLDGLVYRTPPGVRLLLAGTAPPPFNTTRVRLTGDLFEIGFDQLCLDTGGIRTVLGNACASQLGAAGLDTAQALTEGWPAAVRLLQIVLAAEADPAAALQAFSGADKDVAVLLNKEVLHGFDARMQQFVVEIALLDTFCADLCLHATGNAQAVVLLSRLIERNALIVPLDRRHEWYRLHGLLRDFLLREAEQLLDCDRKKSILENAAHWSEQQGDWSSAVAYSLESGSAQLAVAMLERVAALFVRDRGDLQQYIDWAEALGNRGVQIGFEADYWYVWALVFYRRYEYARQQVERLARRLHAQGADSFDAASLQAFQRRLDVIRIAIGVYTDRLDDSYAWASDWLQASGSEPSDPFDTATVAVAGSFYLSANQDYPGTRHSVRTARAAIAQTDSVYGQAWVDLRNASIALAEGEYPSAMQQLDAILSRTRAALGEQAGIVGTISAVAGKCAVAMNHVDQARALTRRGLAGFLGHGVPETAIVGLDAAVKLWCDSGDDIASLDHLRELAAVYPGRVGTMLNCFIVRRLLRLGKVEDALQAAAAVDLNAHGRIGKLTLPGEDRLRTKTLLALTQADLLCACGRFGQSARIYANEQKHARRLGCWADLVELALGEMSVHIYLQNPEYGGRALTRAVTSAAKRRILLPFRERAEVIAGLVNETRAQHWGFASPEEKRFFAEVCHDLPMVNSSLLEQLEDLGEQAALLDTPTAREMELIKLIEAGLTNQQIADHVAVSVSTVKWHLYNLYKKLGVSSRSAALARARALNLLSR